MTGWICWSDVEAHLERDYSDPLERESVRNYLRRHLTHSGHGGGDVIEAGRLDDLLGLWALQAEGTRP